MGKTLSKIILTTTLVTGGAFATDSQIKDIYMSCDTQSAKIESIEKVFKEYKIDEGFLKTRDITAEDKRAIKSCEVAKIKSLPKERIGEYEIEVIDIQHVDDHVEVFARAWSDGGG